MNSVLVPLLAAASVAAQPVEHFARKTITVIIGYTAGGSYDLYGRMIARHLGRHIPGAPTVIAQNMPGAGSLKAANYLYEVAPKDGTALGVIVKFAALEQALANPAVQYDAAKFTISAASPPATTSSCNGIPQKCSRSTTPRAWNVLAGTGPGSIAETVPRLLNALTGTSSSSSAATPPRARRCCDGARRGRRAPRRPGRRQGGKAKLAAGQEDPDHPADHAGTHRRACRRRRAGARSETRRRTNRCSRSTPAAARSGAPCWRRPGSGRAREGLARRVPSHGRRSRIRRRAAADQCRACAAARRAGGGADCSPSSVPAEIRGRAKLAFGR